MQPQWFQAALLCVITACAVLAFVVEWRRRARQRRSTTYLEQPLMSTSDTMRIVVLHILVGKRVVQPPHLTITAPGGRIVRADAVNWNPTLVLKTNRAPVPQPASIAQDGTTHLAELGRGTITRLHLEVEGPGAAPLVLTAPGPIESFKLDDVFAPILFLLIMGSQVGGAGYLPHPPTGTVAMVCFGALFAMQGLALVGYFLLIALQRQVGALLGSPGASTNFSPG